MHLQKRKVILCNSYFFIRFYFFVRLPDHKLLKVNYSVHSQYVVRTASGDIIKDFLLYPCFEKVGGILVYICPSFRPSFRPIFFLSIL